jgi:polysaccharide biosynthesis protein PelF
MNIGPKPAAFPTASHVDVMLLLEGTFPFVAGGVSSWVNQIIRGFPNLSFGAVFLGSRREDYGEMRFALPDNFIHLECHYMHDTKSMPPMGKIYEDKKSFEFSEQMHDAFRQARTGPDAQAAGQRASDMLRTAIPMLRDGGGLSENAFLYGKESWARITDSYRKYSTDPSFVDYFWTVRIMHGPIWTMLKIADSLIPANCYHTISTGYAGFLGAMLRHKTGKPLLLSEHGIYTKERKIDLYQSSWIRDNRSHFEKDPGQLGYFREMWIRQFEHLGKLCYQAADKIIALYETNRLRQITDGAPAERTMNVANGINLARLAALRAKRPKKIPQTLCLIGRVVPIKDIKTFIRAMRTVVQALPEAEAWIAGPEDEDKAYAQECHAIVASLGLSEKVKFLGFQKIDDLLPNVGLGILSSISEALPLVLLEGFAAGVPAIATDVGSCRQLIFGLDEADQALGASGDIVQISDPEALANAAVALLSNEDKYYAAQRAGIARVEKYYTQEMMFGKYRELYDWAVSTGQLVDQANQTGRT